METELYPKITKKNANNDYVKFSFNITYIFLLTTATITFIEAMRTPSPTIRHVLNLETSISLIAGYFYSVFLKKISIHEKDYSKINWADITKTRYIDWVMTTPLMLLALSLTLSNNIKQTISLSLFLIIVILNYAMLYFGYLGEIGKMDRWLSCGLGFIPFIIMFGLIFKNFVLPVYKLSNYVIFGIFISIWSLYGVFYMFSESYKNIGMNTLDCLAKCWFGLGLWAYFSKIIVLN
jgi:bacteriorhodopsin